MTVEELIKKLGNYPGELEVTVPEVGCGCCTSGYYEFDIKVTTEKFTGYIYDSDGGLIFADEVGKLVSRDKYIIFIGHKTEDESLEIL